MGGTGACLLVGGADSYPSGGALSLGVIRGGCVPGGVFVDGCSSLPTQFVVWPGLLSPDW